MAAQTLAGKAGKYIGKLYRIGEGHTAAQTVQDRTVEIVAGPGRIQHLHSRGRHMVHRPAIIGIGAALRSCNAGDLRPARRIIAAGIRLAHVQGALYCFVIGNENIRIRQQHIRILTGQISGIYGHDGVRVLLAVAADIQHELGPHHAEMHIAGMMKHLFVQHIKRQPVNAAASGALAAETLPTAGGTVLYIPSVGCTAPEEDPVFQEFERAVAAQNGMTVRLSAEIRQLREQLPGLLRGTECPRAAFVQDNETAVELLHLLRREELRVPEDIEILCQQNTKLAKLADPSLSVLAPTGYQVGMVGAKCLMDHLDRGDILAPLQLVAPKLVKRGSIK